MRSEKAVPRFRILRVIALCLALILCTVPAGCAHSAAKPAAAPNDNVRTWYEVFVPSYFDSNGDGTGDLRGLAQKLDYLNDGRGGGLGVTGIWLMPIMPSPSYHKYDVTDYFSVDPSLGTLADFRALAAACHRRGVKLILDFEANHTSSQNPWFLSAVKTLKQNPSHPAANPYLSYYNFVRGQPSAGHYAPVGDTGWYYEDEFADTMPDLNLDSPAVRAELFRSARFWLGQGADGFRLDAVLYYYGSDGSGDTDKNVGFVNAFTGACRSVNPGAYVVGEVWSDATTVSSYYAAKNCSFFAFPFAQATGYIAQTLNLSGADYSAQHFALVQQEWQQMLQAVNKNAVDAPFLSNHDQDRSAGYFSGSVAKMKMAAALYLFMDGGPFLYYGEELGMTGSGRDENKRGPMYWSASVKTGMTKGPAGMTEDAHLLPAADAQLKDPQSLLSFYKNAIRLRERFPAVARGEISIPAGIANPEVCAIRKTWRGQSVVLVYNLAPSAQTLDVAAFAKGMRLGGQLSAGTARVKLSGSRLRLPSMSLAVLS